MRSYQIAAAFLAVGVFGVAHAQESMVDTISPWETQPIFTVGRAYRGMRRRA